MRVFISWSGEKSKKIAEVFNQYLPQINHYIETFFSEEISKGKLWFPEINQELKDCSCGIICVTKENMRRPWMLFESGALSMNWETDRSRLMPFLFDISKSDLEGPLTEFQLTENTEEDIYQLVKDINTLSEEPLEDNRLRDSFERYYSDIARELKEIKSAERLEEEKEEEEIRDDRELLEEVLNHVRGISKESQKGVSLKNESTKELVTFKRDLSNELIQLINEYNLLIKTLEERGDLSEEMSEELRKKQRNVEEKIADLGD